MGLIRTGDASVRIQRGYFQQVLGDRAARQVVHDLLRQDRPNRAV